MMVAFRYDNDAVGSLYYSREIPSLFEGCGCRSCSAAKGIITFESNGLVRRGARARRCRGSCSPGFRDIRGYQAMYRDFVAGDPDSGAAPEMSLERAIDDQRLMDQVYASLEHARQ